MQIITFGINAGFVAAVFLVVFFHHELAAFRAILVDGLKVADKVTFGVFGAAVKFFAPAPCPP
jgi:hypothetical protein